MSDIQRTEGGQIGRTAPIIVKERAYSSLRRLSRCQIPSNGHLRFEALDRPPSKPGPFSHPDPEPGGRSGSLGEIIGISKNAVVASGGTESRRGSEWLEILTVSGTRRVTVEADDMLRTTGAGKPCSSSVSEFGFLCGRRGGSVVKRA